MIPSMAMAVTNIIRKKPEQYSIAGWRQAGLDVWDPTTSHHLFAEASQMQAENKLYPEKNRADAEQEGVTDVALVDEGAEEEPENMEIDEEEEEAALLGDDDESLDEDASAEEYVAALQGRIKSRIVNKDIKIHRPVIDLEGEDEVERILSTGTAKALRHLKAKEKAKEDRAARKRTGAATGKMNGGKKKEAVSQVPDEMEAMVGKTWGEESTYTTWRVALVQYVRKEKSFLAYCYDTEEYESMKDMVPEKVWKDATKRKEYIKKNCRAFDADVVLKSIIDQGGMDLEEEDNSKEGEEDDNNSSEEDQEDDGGSGSDDGDEQDDDEEENEEEGAVNVAKLSNDLAGKLYEVQKGGEESQVYKVIDIFYEHESEKVVARVLEGRMVRGKFNPKANNELLHVSVNDFKRDVKSGVVKLM